MKKRLDVVLGRETSQPDDCRPQFSGYWFKMPAETDLLMRLKPAELKVYLVVLRAIQRDRNGGLLSARQIAERANLRSRQHAQKAVESLCRTRLLIRLNPATGAELTEKKDWIGRPIRYGAPIQWKQRDTDNLHTGGGKSEPEHSETVPAHGNNHNLHTQICSNLHTPVHQHSESLESSSELDIRMSSSLASPPGQSGRESSKAADDEKPFQKREQEQSPEKEFLLRIAERHPKLDAHTILENVQAELRKGDISLSAFLDYDLTATTNPKALTNPHGHYRNLAQKMVTKQQDAMRKALLDTVPVVCSAPEPTCPKCEGGGRVLELVEGQRPLQTIEYCDCRIVSVNAEDFKQGAKINKASVSRRECVGTLLKIPLC